MKKIVIFLILMTNFLFAEINECKSDIYYGNGIMTTKAEAEYSLYRVLKPAILNEIYNNDKEAMNKLHHFDVAYNYSAEEKFGDTPIAMLLDLLESYEQLGNTSYTWKIVQLFIDKAFLSKLNIAKNWTQKKLKKHFMDNGLTDFLANFLADKLVSTAFNGYMEIGKKLVEYNPEKIHDDDLKEMQSKYIKSIEAGHGVVLISHSQGNLFALEAMNRVNFYIGFSPVKDWMRKYVYQISIASPAPDFASEHHWLISLDNDIVANIPLSVGTNFRNPIRYFTHTVDNIYPAMSPDKTNEWIYNPPFDASSPDGYWSDGTTPPSFSKTFETDNGFGQSQSYTMHVVPDEWDYLKTDFHALNYYMGLTSFETNIGGGQTIKRKSKETRQAIINSIRDAINKHKEAPSQWEKDKEFNCGCEKRIKVVHKYDNFSLLGFFQSDLNKIMQNEKVLSFDDDKKLYKVDAQYVKATCGGESVEENANKNICYDLKDKDNSVIDQFISEDINTPDKKSGVVEISLEWDNPSLDYDLVVNWEAGETDVKNTPCKGYEHFYVKDDWVIYPGRYSVRVVYKDGAEDINDSLIFPIEMKLNIYTPGAVEKFHFNIKERKYLSPEHVADIKIYRVDEENNDNNSTVSINNNSDNTPNTLLSPPIIIIATEKSLKCPPVKYTPSPTPPRAIYYSYSVNGNGSSGVGKSTNSTGGVSGSYSIGSSVSSGTAIHIGSPKQNSSCAGDISCLPTIDDLINSDSDENAKKPHAPLSPSAGGRPIRDIEQEQEEEEDECTGNLSCHCIPCEYEIISYLKQVYFGPLRNADYSIYALDSYLGKDAFYSAKTTNGETLYNAGEIDIPTEVLAEIRDDELYIIEVSGGEDIDIDDDFHIDALPTPNNGKVYAIASGYDLKYDGFKVNILTTVAYELVKDMITKQKSKEEISQKLQDIASRLLRYKVYPQDDESINNIDLLAWLPTVDKDILQRSYEPLEVMVHKIYNNEDIYEDAYSYVYFKSSSDDNVTKSVTDATKPPIVKGFTGFIDENATGGTIVGTIEVLRGSDDISFGVLSGIGSELFDINSSGTIWLKEGSKLDYETKWLYKLKAEAFNSNGGSGKVGVYISVENILDAPEFIGFDGGTIAEDAPSGTIVGTLHYNEGASPITSIELQGKSQEYFEVDNKGVVRLKADNYLDYEKRYSHGFVVLAHNSFGVSMPIFLYINVLDVPDIPIFLGYKGGYIHEDAKAGEKIGQVYFDKGGSEVTHVELEGFGSENFTIDLNGTLRVAEGASLDYETYSLYEPTVSFTNSYGSSNSKRIFIALSDVQDVPTFSSFSGGNVKENSRIGTVVGTINYLKNPVDISSITLSGDGADMFEVLPNGTIFVAKNELNYEEKNIYNLSAVASNIFGSSRPLKLYIYIDDISERSAILEDFVKNDIIDNTPIGTVIGQVKVIDQGSSEIISYKINGTGSKYFTIDDTGAVLLNKMLNYEKQKIYNLKYQAKNSAGFSHESNFIIRVKSRIGVIPELHHISVYIDKELAIGEIVENILTDEGKAPVTFVSLTPTSPFILDRRGNIRVGESLSTQTEKSYTLHATMENFYGVSEMVDVNIFIIQPPVVSDLTLNEEENTTIGSILGKINISNPSKSFIYKIDVTGENAEYFNIDGNGSITLKHALDYEKKTYYMLDVTAYNSAGASHAARLHINVLDIDDSIVLSSYSVTIHEDVEKDKIIGQVPIVSFGGLSIDRFVLSGNGNESFNISASGDISISSSADFNDKITPFYRFNLKAISTNAEESNVVSFDVRVQDSLFGNPVIAPLELSVDENISVGSVIGKIPLVSEGSSHINSYVLTRNYKNEFSINKNGNIIVNSKLDYETTQDYNLSVVAKNTKTNSKPVELIIHVLNIPDTVAVIENFKVSIDENISIGTKIGKITISNPGEAPISAFSLHNKGHENFEIDTNGTVRIANKAHIDYEKYNYFTLEVKAISSIGESIEKSFIVKIIDTGYPPIIENFSAKIKYNRALNRNIGKVKIIDYGDTYLQSFKLSGKGNKFFKIDRYGSISLATSFKEQNSSSYFLKACADNKFGSSNLIDVNISVEEIPVLIEDYSTILFNGFYGTNWERPIDNLNLTEYGVNFARIELQGEGSKDFYIDTRGRIYIASGVTLRSDRQDEYNLTVVVDDFFKANVDITIKDSRVTNVLSIPDMPLHRRIEYLGKVYKATNSGLEIALHDEYYNVIGTIAIPNGVKNFSISSDGKKIYAVGNDDSFYDIDIRNTHPLNVYDISKIVEENSTINTVIGNVLDNDYGIISATLSGDGASDFSIGLDGKIRVNKELNNSIQKNYNLRAKITSNITSKYVDVKIQIHSIPEIQDLIVKLKSYTSENTIIGTLDMWQDDASTIKSISLSGHSAKKFVVTKDGDIYTAPGITLEYPDSTYNLYVTATNSYGKSKESKIIINITPIISSIDSFADEVFLFQNDTKLLLAHFFNLSIYDISNIDEPIRISGLNPNFNGEHVISSDAKRLYTISSSRIVTANLEDIYSPYIETIYNYDNAHRQPIALFSEDNTKLYIANENALHVIDVNNSQLNIIGNLEIYFNKLFLLPNKNKLIGSGKKNVFIDINDSTEPTLYNTEEFVPEIGDKNLLSFDKKTMYVAYAREINIYDISNINNITLIDSIKMTNSFIKDFALSSDESKLIILYDSEIYIVEIDNHAYFKKIDNISTGYRYLKLFANDTRLLVQTSDGIEIMDTCNMILPRFKSIKKDIIHTTPIGTVIGDIYDGHKEYTYLLSGRGAKDFSIDNNGTIRVAKLLDASKSYDFAVLINICNSSHKRIGHVNIKVLE